MTEEFKERLLKKLRNKSNNGIIANPLLTSSVSEEELFEAYRKKMEEKVRSIYQRAKELKKK